ncbi:MAG: ABC transporter ATP-binding protein [Defluviitaleaceae bacterium]|nr:ABC transporter ATP-binding protein [Defluviitaleaceae bacterium]MCL2238512.1 ABC transporter ATP-binding protein [Defluviitaleaceae bacterium]
MNATVLTVRNLSKCYSTGKGIKNVSFELQKGTILGIIGLNGAGKTTLLSCLTGFLNWDAGDVKYSLSGKTYNKVQNEVLENLGIVSAEYGFPGHFNAKTVCSIMSNTYKKWDKARFYHVLEQLELDSKLKIVKFSTGMKTKLAIAIALSHNAKILVLDEATNGLDVKASAKVRELLHTHVADGENAIILTSHIMGEIERMSDAIMFIDDGNIRFNCNKDDLMHQYKVFPMTSKRLGEIDRKDLIRIKKGDHAVRVIAKDPKAFSEKYTIEPEVLPLDTIIEMFLEGENVA